MTAIKFNSAYFIVVKVNYVDYTPDDKDKLHIYEVSQIPARSEGKLMDTL